MDLLRILHLEDEPLDSELAQETLAGDGMRVQLDRVDTLADLTAALRRGGYSLVLSDYTIPGVDVLEALGLVRATTPELPFVFLSGTIGEERATQALKLGASDYVLKQRMSQLPQVVRRALGEAKEAARRRHAEESLRRSEERLRLSQEAAQLGSFEWNVVTGRIEWSFGMELLYGIGRERAPGTIHEALELVHPEDRAHLRRLLDSAIEVGRFSGEWRIIRPDQSVRWLAGRGHLFRDGQGRPERLLGVSMDVTERKEAEVELTSAITEAERARRVAEEATRAKDHFIAILSHELRTPLTAVMPALDTLRTMVGDSCTEYLDMASRNVALEARLIEDLLDITRIAQGKVELSSETVDLCTIVQWAAEVCQPDISAKGQHFLFYHDEAPHVVKGDPSRLQQVFCNLIQNAVKFTPRGGCIGVRATKVDGKSRVDVSDSGTGIAPDAIARIFNAFEQETVSTTRQFGGLGLGLAISKSLVEMHSGTIRASSAGHGLGATFSVELPLLGAAAALELKKSSKALNRPVTPCLRILLVEDHVDTAKIISLVLRKAGHEVSHAPDVARGVELARSREFDLLLSDLGLPDASGLDLMRQLREGGSNLRGIALSGYAQPEDVRRSIAAGFSEHVAKPINANKLLALIADVFLRA